MIDFVSVHSLQSLLLLFSCLGLPILLVWRYQSRKRSVIKKRTSRWLNTVHDSIMAECLYTYDEIAEVQKDILLSRPDYAGREDMMALSKRLALISTVLTNPPHDADQVTLMKQYEGILQRLKDDLHWLETLATDLA